MDARTSDVVLKRTVTVPLVADDGVCTVRFEISPSCATERSSS